MEAEKILTDEDFATVFAKVQSATTALWHIADWCGTLEEIAEHLQSIDATKALLIADEIEKYLRHTTAISEEMHLRMLRYSVELFAETQERNSTTVDHGR